jgi:hypothetical protein
MKNKFCKIFELPKAQVLIRMEQTEDGYGLVQETDFEGVHPRVTLGYDQEEKCQACFDSYSKKEAKNFLECVQKMFEENG